MDQQLISKWVVKLAAMAANGSGESVRVRVDGGCLVQTEQSFWKEDLPRVVLSALS